MPRLRPRLERKEHALLQISVRGVAGVEDAWRDIVKLIAAVPSK